MKIIFFLLLFMPFFAFAGENPITVSGKIQSVTVFRQGAKLSGTATATVAQGIGEIVITDLTSNAEQQSLQVRLSVPQVHLLSATYRVNYLKSNTATARISLLRDSLVILQDQLNGLQDQIRINTEEDAVIKRTTETRLGGTEKGVSFEDLKNIAAYYQNHLLELSAAQRKLTKQLAKTTLLQQQYQGTLNDLDANSSKPTGEIVLKIDADNSASVNIDFSLFSNAASWNPIYDLKAASESSKPLTMIYKANITQSTGYAWKGVQLFVSSGNPNTDNTVPKLEARYVDYLQVNAEQQANQYAPPQSNISLSNSMSVTPSYTEPPPAANDAGVTIEKEISRRQDIASDGQEHLLQVEQYEIPVTYEYQTVPRKETAAFLLAKVTNFGQYGLISGTANLFFNETYVGQSQINPYSASDTLYLSMGRDERVVVKRSQLKDVSSVRLFSDTKKETIGYKMIVRNNKSQAIDLEITDNIPISRNKDIVVDIEEKTGAQVFPDFGEVVWNLRLNPNETKEVTLVYTVKYPKKQKISFGLQTQHVRANRGMIKR